MRDVYKRQGLEGGLLMAAGEEHHNKRAAGESDHAENEQGEQHGDEIGRDSFPEETHGRLLPAVGGGWQVAKAGGCAGLRACGAGENGLVLRRVGERKFV